ncbi:MAG: DUF4340 domain-containing protein [Akkermansiaceae bacterium]
MSRLQLLILWILALVAGIIFVNSNKAGSDTASETDLKVGDTLVSTSHVNSVDGIKISVGEDTTTLKKIDNRWSVAEQDNFPANISQVSRLITNLEDAKIAQGVTASAEYYNRFNLDPATEEDENKPQEITLSKEGEEDITIFIGKNRENRGRGSAGRFVRLGNDDSGVYVTSQAFAGLAADPKAWIVKTLSLVEEGALKIEVSAPQDADFKPWSVSRKTTLDNLTVDGLGEEEETVTNETNQMKTVFTSSNFTQLLTPGEAKEKAGENGTREVRITDSSGSVFLFTLTPEKVVIPDDAPKDEPASTEPANYIVSFKVVNGPTRPEPPAEDAPLKEKAEFEARLENMGDIKISVENNKKTYEGRFLLMTKASVGSLLKNRSDLIKAKKKETPKTTVTTPPVAVPPAGTGSVPPGIARPMEKKKIEAVTPPIAVPPNPDKTDIKPTPPKQPNLTPPPVPGSKPSETNTPEGAKDDKPEEKPSGDEKPAEGEPAKPE